jgi:hypothetical protein
MTVLCAVLAATSPSSGEAADPVTRDQIIRASKTYPGAGRAAADYQATESQKAAQRLIDQLNKEKEEEQKKAAAQRTVIPGPAAQAPVVTQRSYEVKNELMLPEDTAATQRQKAVGVEHRMLQSYND